MKMNLDISTECNKLQRQLQIPVTDLTFDNRGTVAVHTTGNSHVGDLNWSAETDKVHYETDVNAKAKLDWSVVYREHKTEIDAAITAALNGEEWHSIPFAFNTLAVTTMSGTGYEVAFVYTNNTWVATAVKIHVLSHV